jgi:hypothetical protein
MLRMADQCRRVHTGCLRPSSPCNGLQGHGAAVRRALMGGEHVLRSFASQLKKHAQKNCSKQFYLLRPYESF